MKKIIYSIVVLFFIIIADIGNGQNMIPKKCYLHLLGTIDKEYPVEMNLVKINDTVYGDFSFIQSRKKPIGKDYGNRISVSGKMSSSDNFILKESNTDLGFVFSGKFISSQNLTGTLEDGSGLHRSLQFEFTEKYPDGSIGLNVYYQKAAMPLVKKPGSPFAGIQLAMLLPGESANPLISDSLIHLMLVKFTGKQIRNNQPEKMLDGMKQIYFENYLAANEGIYRETMASSFNWQSLKFLHVLMNGSHILSFYIDHYAYTGGAHGLQTRQFTVVNLWTGKEVGLSDIFKVNSELQLSRIISDKIHEKNHLPTLQSLKDVGFFSDTVRPSYNFYLTREGIGFYYNQYDIASYANGSFDVFVPFAELKDLLNGGGFIKELIR